jgi:uncharacterized repeat protein (TIGR01451 family)
VRPKILLGKSFSSSSAIHAFIVPNMEQTKLTLRRKVLSAVIAFVQVASAVGAATVATIKPPALEPLVGAPETAAAHNLQMEIGMTAIDPSSRPMFDARLGAGQPLIQVGDVITVVFGGLNFIGTTDGLGGYFDFYPLTGTQVVNAEYVVPVPGGYAPVPIKKSPGFGVVIGTTDPTGQLKNFTLGPNINGVTSKPTSAGNVSLGTLNGVYGDTGIFYSTDPRTGFGSFPATGNIVNNRGEDVDNDDFTGQPVPLTRFDVDHLRALGMSSPQSCIFDSACRGTPPWGLGSPVAGPQSGYQWQFVMSNPLASLPITSAVTGPFTYTIATGPFQRIQYPGSQISNDTPGNTSGAVFDTSKDASNIGYALSPGNPLPATTSWSDNTSTKLVRFAVGRIVYGQPEYARVAIKINSTSDILDAQGCPRFTAMAFSGDAGINSGGKDHLWRYFNPTIKSVSPCLLLFKEPSKVALATNEVFTYSLRAFNTGPITLTNVSIRDTLPAGLQYISAVPAPTSGTNPQQWNIGSLPPNRGWSAVLTVRALSPGIQVNNLTLTSDQGGAGTQAIVGVAVPIMNETKSVAPASVAPGGTITYTIRLRNTGTGNSSVPIRVNEFLPTGFSFGSLRNVTVNGANVTGSSTAVAAGTNVTISLPSTSFIAPNNEAVIVFTAQVGGSTTAGSYCNNFNVAYGSTIDQVANVACVTVGGGAIGDTVYRDWNGNGVQDPGEEGLPGAVVQLTPPSGPVITVTTNASGTYLFNGLVAGNYTVTVISGAAGYTPTQGSSGYPITLATNQQFMTADFGFQPAGPGVIGDTVYNDIANNGAQDAGDTGIPNVTVWLYEDTNGNGRIDAVQDNLIFTTTTNVSGTYSFTNLATGLNYIARVDNTDPDIDTAVGGASANTTPTTVAVPNLSGAFLNADFGFWQVQPGSIGDTVCVDANLDGLCTAGESGVPNVPVFLFLDGVQIASTTTSITGTYSFNNLGPGNYTVAIDRDDPSIPAQLVPALTNIPVTLAPNQNVTTADFPLQPLLTKQVNRTSANLSDTLIYTITPNYNGNNVLDNLAIKDPLPAGTQFITASAGGVFGPFVPQPRVDGFDEGDGSYTAGMTVTVVPTTTRVGGTVTVTMRVTVTGSTITNVVPSITPVNGDATCSAPNPTGPVTVSTAQLFTFTCIVLDYGEYSFLGDAGGLQGGAGYDFPSGQSNSLLASHTGSTSLVTWTLGSTREAVDGISLSTGSVPVIYATRGGTGDFDVYYVLTNTWSNAPANYGSNVKQGGALVWNGSTGAAASIFGLRGDTQQTFRRYDVSTNSWTARANTPNDIKWGGALTRIGDVIYAFRGDDRQDFYTYTISSNTWATAASFGATVKEGGSLTTNGTFVYGLRGDGSNQFRRYNPATNSWTVLANTPANIKNGGALIFLGGFIYALRGDTKNSFWRYNISTNTWAAMANTPANVKDGGALTTDGTFIYALRGDGTRVFWRYNPTTNSWSTLASTLGNIVAGGALAFVPGTASVSRQNTMGVNDVFVSSGQRITLTQSLFATSNENNISPGTLVISDSALAGGTATCTGPTPTPPVDVVANTITTFSWSCILTATTRPANIFFSADARRAANVIWDSASSPSVIVVPPITMTLRVLSPTTVSTVDNVAVFGDDSGTVGPAPSNLVRTTIGSAIGDFVWVDLDRDGVQDGNEPGLAGVVITLTPSTGPVLTTTTDLNGNYTFGNLGSGTFTVTYNLATAPAGYAPTTPIQLTYNITAAQVITTADFGLKPPGLGAIGDTVWLDADNDGVLDNGEQGLPGITVRLYADVNNSGSIDAGDVVITSTVTDATGYYTFTNLYAGPYLVQVDTTSTVTSSIYGFSNGFTATLGAAMTPTIGTTITRAVSLTTNSTITDTIDFGFNWSGYIGDYGWYDSNGNGIQNDAGDEGPARDVVIELVYDVNNNGEYDIGEPLLVYLGPNSTGTGPDGFYAYYNLPPGNYIIEGEGQAVPAPPSTGALSGTVGVMMNTTPYEIPFTLGAGQSITTFDFGFAAGAIVEGHIWYDENSSGVRDPLEATGFAGIVVTLTGVISTPTGFQNVVLTTTTDSSGEYEFPPVLPGTFTVTYNTAAPQLANFPLQTTPTSQTFDIRYGEEKEIDFGRDYSGAIGDLVWVDSNNNLTQTVGEPGIAGATVLLYQNGNLVDATTSGITGSYLFTGLPAGTYTVTVLTSTIPASLTQITTPASNVWTVNLITNTSVLTADFGYRSLTPVFTVTGRVVSDTTGTIGVVDGTDPGLKPNVQVNLVYTPPGGAPISVIVPVDANGNYTVTGILQGSNVEITVVPASVPLGYTNSTTPTLTINNIAANVTNQNFGFVFAPASLAGTVVIGNGNGIAEVPTETAVSGVTITLLYAGPDGLFGTGGDDQVFTTTTNASGQYSFANLLPGQYFVTEIVPAGYNMLADRDGGVPTEIFATLAISQNLTGQDFELEIIPADLKITKRDSADPIVAGNRLTYTLVVTNDGPGVSYNTIVSDSLPAGVSYVSASPIPSSTSPITWSLGTLDVNASRTFTVVVDVNRLFSGALTNTASITSTTPDITPTNNIVTETTGVTPGVGSITGTVFVDTNGNGQLDPGEPGLPDVTVLITDSNNLTYTITTDVNGLYTQTNVTIGTATVDIVSPPAGYVQTAGTDPSTVNVPPAGTGNAGIDGYQPQADLRINKTNNLAQVVPGTLVTYTIVVTNSGPISVTGARIADTVPVTLANAGWACVAGAGASCGLPSSGSGSLNGISVTLAVNSVLTFTLTGTVMQTATGNIANTAVVTPPLGITDPITNNNTSTDDDPLVPQADLQVTKSNGVNGLTPGTVVTYTIVVTNAGPSAVTGATVTDTLPVALTGASWTCATCTPANGSSDISVTVDLLSGQSAVITLTGTVNANATGSITNTAVVAPPPGVTDTVPGNNTDTDTDPLTPQADLGIFKTNELNAVVPGNLLTYTIVVSNAGPSAAWGAQVTDTLPITLSEASWACVAGAGASCGTSFGIDNIAGVSLIMAPNSLVTFTVTGTVISTATGFITNTAVVAPPPGVTDPTPGNNTSSDNDPLTPLVNLSIFKTNNQSTVVPGTRITYTIAVTNAGPSAATNVVISDAIPSALLSPAWSCAGTTCNSPTSGSGNISTTVTLLPGGRVTFTVVATVSLAATGRLTNTASLTPPPGVTNTNSVTESTDGDPLTPALITGTIFVDTNGNGQLNPGEPPLTGVSVVITDSQGVTRSVPVDTNGNYTATLPPGPFTTTVNPATVPPGYVLTSNNSTQTGTAVPDTTTPTNPVGYQPRGDVTGIVFLDTNGNGTPDPGEGLPNVQVVITDAFGAPVIVTTTASGQYTATGVPSGTATVDVVNSTLPVGVTQTVGIDPSTVVVNPGVVNNAGVDGYRQLGDVTGTVFLDTNGNGLVDPGEGLPNVQVVITDSAGLTQTFLTDPNGLYTFTEVTSGTAVVNVIDSTLPNGVTQTVGTDPTNVTVLPNQTNFEENNGYRQLGTVTGFVYNDVDGNGSYNPLTDVVSSGVTVVITDSAGLTQTTTTLANGFFTFTEVTSGTARVDLINPPAGTQTQGNDPTDMTVVPNQTNFEQNNGFFNPATVTGLVFEDTNANGTQDPGEPGLPGVTVMITNSQGAMTTTVTDANGLYTFTQVVSGPATVDVVDSTLPQGYVHTPAGVDPSPVTVVPGQVNDAGIDGYQPQADLRISKTDGQTVAVPGTRITYTIVVTNAGPAPVVGARITDTLPAELQSPGWTCVAGAGAACPTPSSGSTMNNLSVTLAVNSVLTFTLTSTVNANATDSITNTVAVTTPPGVTDPTPNNNVFTDTDTLQPRADLQIDKGNGVASVVPGDRMTYTIVVTNAGPSAVVGARITDTLPVTLSNASWACVAGPNTVCGTTSGIDNIENISVTMQPNSVLTFTVTGTVISTATGFITNTAVVAPPPGVIDPTPGNNTSSDNDPLTPLADLQIVKDDGVGSVVPGTQTTYRITVTNAGPSAVSGATVSDTLPPALTNATWTCATCAPTSGSGNINTSVSLLPGQSVVILLTGTVAADASGNIVNVASVTPPAGVTDTLPNNNVFTDTNTLNPQADLQIAKTNNVNAVVPGTLVTYTVVVTNAGPSAVTGARITDTIPANLLNTGWVCVAGSGATCPTPASGSAMNNLSVTMGVNSVLTFTLTGTVSQSATGNLVNTAVVTTPAGVTDPTPGNNTAIDDDPTDPRADLQIVKDDGLTTATPGLTLTYRITVTNNGPSAVNGATVSDTLPAALTDATWTCAVCAPNSGSGSSISTSVNLVSGGVAVVVVTATVAADATGSITNTAVVTPPPGVTDPTPGNNTDTDLDTLVPSVDLQVLKRVQPAGNVVPGTAITYTVVVTNAGPSKAVNAPVTDTFPIALTSINWTCAAGAGASCGTSSGTSSINGVLVTLDGNSAVTFTVNGIVAANATGNIVNTAVVTVPAGAVDPTPVNNTSTVTNSLTPEAFLGIFKTDNQSTAVPGTRITYTVAVTNGGPSTANGVAISDAIPSALLSPAWSCAGTNGATCNAPTSGSGDISTTVNVPAGGEITFSVVATLSLNATGRLTNTARLTPPPGLTNTNPVTQSTDVDDITPAIITGTIFVDTNGNGELNPGEPPLTGVSVIITDSQGVTRSVPVDANGNYSVTLPPGPFTTTVNPATVPPGYVLTTNNDTQNGTATPGVTTPTVPVGYQPQGTVTGFVYIDYNGNGTFSSTTDVPLQGVTVTVLSQGKLITVVTDASGYFTATGVPSGTATVDLMNPPPYVQTQGTDPTSVTVLPAQNNFEENNGFFVTGSITGTVFQDTNGDGDQDPGEPLLGFVSVLITDSLGVTRTVQTDVNGVYTATLVPSGTATVDVVDSTLPPGLRQTAGVDPSTVNVVPNTTQNAGIDGYQPTATVGNRVWEDYNFNGVQDNGEPGVPGVTVTLQTPTGTIQTVTNASGEYTFTNLIPNAVHTMTFIAPAGGYTFTVQNLGTEATDSDPNPTTGVVTFTLAPAEVNSDYDAGLWRPMTLGDSVWFDANGDGVKDVGEAGVPSVKVELYRDVNNNGVFDAGDTLVTTTSTDAAGQYTFTNQISGTYLVVITSTNFVAGGALLNYQSSDGAAAGNSDQNGVDHGIVAGTLGTSGFVTSVVTLIPGTEPINDGDSNNNTNLSLDFGFYSLSLASNLVWEDFNNNGLYEPGLGEMPIPSVTVLLLNAGGTPLLTTQTDASGLYTFTNLVSGTYQVQVVLPADYVNSTFVPTQTLGIDNDNNGVTTTQGSTFSSLFTLVPGATQPINNASTASSANNTIDFGLWQPMTLGGQAWNDKNNNGQLENGEALFPGVAVELYLADGSGLPTGAPVSTTTTVAGGFYTFTNILSGTYVVVITSTNFAPGGVLAGFYNSDGAPVTNNNIDNDDDGRPFNNAAASGPIPLVPGTEPGGNLNTTVDFGFYTLSLGGAAWNDANNSGVQDAGETGLPGYTVNLYRADSNGQPIGGVLATTTTSASGAYTFTGLISDTYMVEIVPQGSYRSSTGVNGSPTGPYEPAPNVDINTAITDDNGTQAGNVIRTGAINLSAGSEPTAEDGDANTNFTVGFGLFQPISIGNQVWNDANNDGQLNSEAGIDGVTVNIYSGTVLVSSTVTAGGGFYTFTNLIPGSYVVEVIPPAGYVSSSGSNGNVTGPFEPAPSPNNFVDNDDNGTTVTNTVRSSPVTVIVSGTNSYPTVDFGLLLPATIGNRVWIDAIGNGIQDSGETGLVGAQVVLYDALTNSPIATTTTGADGLYTFTKVISGSYYLVFPVPVGYSRTGADANGNTQDTLDSDANASGQTPIFNVVAGETRTDLDAGFFQLSSIGDRVWNDLNANGIQDAGEPGVQGVTVTLFFNGAPVSTTLTDNTGFYAFVNITPGVPLSVQVAVPAGFIVTPQNASADETIDNDADAQGRTGSVSILQDTFYRDLDIALWAPLTLGGSVWDDLNNNGAQAGGELPKDGVLVRLYRDSNSNGIFDAGDEFVQQATSASGGNYTFTNLIQGNYLVVLDPSNFAPGGVLAGYKSSDFNDTTDANNDGLDDGRPAFGGSIASGVIRMEAGSEPSGLLKQENYTVDFGVWLPASLSGVVWLDVDHDGQQDAGEPARNGVPVSLRDAQGNVVSTTTTGVINGVPGSYRFENLIPGSYYVTFPLPDDCVPAANNAQTANTGCIWTYPNQGNDATDSDVGANGQTDNYTLVPGQNENTVGAGYWRPPTLVPGKSTKVIGPVKTGDLITYTLEVRNSGDTLATSVVITDPLPNGVSFVSASNGGQMTPGGVVWRLPDLMPSQIASVQVVVRVGNPTGETLIINIFTVANDGLPGTTLTQPSNQVSTPFAPTAVTLVSFRAVVENRGVRVTWQTALERNTFGFYVLRSVTGNRDDAVQVNAEMVIATGPNTYSVVDEAGSAGNTYWLQEVELNGTRIDYGPVVAQASLPGVTRPQPSQPSQPAPNAGVPSVGSVGVAGGGVAVQPQAQPAAPQQPEAQPAAQGPAVIPAVPAVILPEPTAQPPVAQPSVIQQPQAQPVAEQPAQPAAQPQAQPVADQPQQPVAQPAQVAEAMPAPTAESVVVGAQTGVNVARGGQPAAAQLPASTTPAAETVEAVPQPINPLLPAALGLGALGAAVAGAVALRKRGKRE